MRGNRATAAAGKWLGGMTALLVVVLTLAAFMWLAYVSSRGGETAPLYSIRRFDPYGAAGLAKLLARRGHEVISLQRPRLDREHHGTLIQLLDVPDKWALRDEHPYRLPTDQLLQWVSQGNTLIQFSRMPTAVMDELGVSLSNTSIEQIESYANVEASETHGVFPDQLDQDGHALVTASWDTGQAGDDITVTLRSPNAFVLDPQDAAWQPIARDGPMVLACTRAYGQGSVVLVASPSPALNHYLGEGGNLEAVLSLIEPDEPVIFDEWAHGVGHAGTVMDVIVRFGLLPLLGQIALGIVMYRWMTAGLQVAPDAGVGRRRSSHEQIDTLGHLYDQSLDMPEKARRVYDELAHRFAKACRCEPSQVFERLRSRQDAASQAALQLLEELRGVTAAFRPVCLHCGYDLTAIAADHCPECGRMLSRSQRRLVHRDDLQAVAGKSTRITSRELARFLTQSHQLSRELSIG